MKTAQLYIIILLFSAHKAVENFWVYRVRVRSYTYQMIMRQNIIFCEKRYDRRNMYTSKIFSKNVPGKKYISVKTFNVFIPRCFLNME